MKPEEHIHFLSDLLNVIEELQTLVREHCREMTSEEEKPYWITDQDNSEKMPF